MISLNNTAPQVLDWLKAQIDSDDSVVVLEIRLESDWSVLRAQQTGID